MSFFKNPLQKKFIPVLIALFLGVMCAAVDQGAHRLVPLFVWLSLGAMQSVAADQPLGTIAFWGYVAGSSLFTSIAVLMAFSGAWLAFLFAAAIAAFPISIVFTRRRQEPPHVQ